MLFPSEHYGQIADILYGARWCLEIFHECCQKTSFFAAVFVLSNKNYFHPSQVSTS